MTDIVDKIRIDANSSKPIYQQLVEQFQQLLGTDQIKAGEQLPSVRHLAHVLNINPNTVARAYMDLQQKRIVVSKHGAGTIVTSSVDDPVVQEIRQTHLKQAVNDDIITLLSQGYSPEELEAVFYSSLQRWSEERRISSKSQDRSPLKPQQRKTLRFVGSHDVALNMLMALLRQQVKDIDVELTFIGSLGGLIALEEGKADIAGTHLLDEETGEYNLPFIKRILPGQEVAVINLVYRIQGLMFAAGNPKRIKGIADLIKPGTTFINRQKGSGTRVLLDMQLKRQGINPLQIKGYDRELDTHLAVGSAVVSGKADVGLGIKAVARSSGLDFLPLFRERYDLAIPGHIYRSEIMAPLLKILKSIRFKKIVDKVDGYDISETGATIIV